MSRRKKNRNKNSAPPEKTAPPQDLPAYYVPQTYSIPQKRPRMLVAAILVFTAWTGFLVSMITIK